MLLTARSQVRALLGEAYIASQKSEGWVCLRERYDDGGFTCGNLNRPAMQRLLADIEVGKVDCVVVYKVDRLSRSLLDFARIMDVNAGPKVWRGAGRQWFSSGVLAVRGAVFGSFWFTPPLSNHLAAVRTDDLTCNIIRRVTTKKSHQAGNLFRCSHTAKRNFGYIVFQFAQLPI
jgi:hypothetical protein